MIDQSIIGNFDKPALVLSYTFALLLVSILILLLPVVYCVLVAGVAYATYYHAINHYDIYIQTLLLDLIKYYVPLVIGVLLVIFMLAPIVLRQKIQRHPTLTITPQNAPTFIEFVHAICDHVGSRRPHKIHFSMEVNASAYLPNILSNKLELTVGFPLIECMNTRELAGVLAHEFGHFSQYVSMRCYIIIHHINAWFDNCINSQEKVEAWVETVNEERDDLLLAIILLIAQTFLSYINSLLESLLYLSEKLTLLLSRQMEFNADKYEILFSGSDCCEKTTKCLHQAYIDYTMALNQLNDEEGEESVDNIPALITLLYKTTNEDVHQHIEVETSRIYSSTWSTHPPDAERIEQARQIKAKGVFVLEKPAIHLFKDYEKKSQLSTLNYYRLIGIDTSKVKLKPIGQSLTTLKKSIVQHATLDHFCNKWFLTNSVWRFSLMDKISQYNEGQLIDLLKNTIKKIRQNGPENNRSTEQFTYVFDNYIHSVLQDYAKNAGYEISLPVGKDNLQAWQKDAFAQFDSVKKTVAIYNAHMGIRILAAVFLLRDQKRRAQATFIIKCLQLLKKVEVDVYEAEKNSALLETVARVAFDNNDEGLQNNFNHLIAELNSLTKIIENIIIRMPGSVIDERSGKELLHAKQKANTLENQHYIQERLSSSYIIRS